MAVRHVPASHPVLRRMPQPALTALPGPTRTDIERFTRDLELLAQAVYEMPHQQPTDLQSRLLIVIADELRRRAHLISS